MKSLKMFCFLVCSLVLLISHYAVSDCTTPCQNTDTCPSSTLVEYFNAPNVGSCSTTAPQATCINPQASCIGGVCQIKLLGRLYVPTKPVPKHGFPAIILNHGSASDPPHFPGFYCGVIRFFVKKGYVVLLPYRYGNALDPQATNMSTGVYDNDPLSLFSQGTLDVAEAVDFLVSNAPVNPDKIAYVGHSYGAMTSIFTNSLTVGQKAVVSISADSESWGNQPLLDQLLVSVDYANAPLFFLQPKNDVNISATPVLFGRAASYPDNERSEAAIYGPVAYAPTGECAHICFVYDDKIIKNWGTAVLDFLKRNGVK